MSRSVVSPLVFAATLLTSSSAWAQPFFGTSLSINPGGSSFEAAGGEGETASSLAGSGSSASATGVGSLTPTVSANAAGNGLGQSSAFGGLLGAYRYDGAAPGTVTLSYQLNANLLSASGTPGGFLRARAGLLNNVTFFEVNLPEFFNGERRDDDTITTSDTGSLMEAAELSFVAQPGEVFNAILSVQNSATGDASFTQATLSGVLSATGGSVTAVPEPTSMALLAASGSLLIAGRRRPLRA